MMITNEPENLIRLKSILNDEAVVQAAEDLLSLAYARIFGPNIDKTKPSQVPKEAISRLKQLKKKTQPDFVQAAAEINTTVYQKNNPHFWFNAAYQAYKEKKETIDSLMFLKHITLDGARILDYGCGGGHLSKKLLEAGCDVTMADIKDFRPDQNKQAPFILLHSIELPESDNSFDVVICKHVLHHIHPDELIPRLKELARVGKKLLVLEDLPHLPTQSEAQEVVAQQPEATIVAQLSPSQQRQLLTLLDYYGNLVAQGLLSLSIPFNYQTPDQWKDIFKESNWKLTETRYLGFLPHHVHGFFQVLYVCESVTYSA